MHCSSVLLMICILTRNMAQLWYGVRTTFPMFIRSCNEKHVDSLLLCTAFGREANGVTFFFNADTYICQWNCTFIFTTDVTNASIKWHKYGKDLRFSYECI